MKISGKSPSPMQNSENAKSAKASGADSILDAKDMKKIGKATAAGVSDSARVDLSSRAQEMAKAKALATPSDDVDDAKVARLQKMIDAGEYKVDAEALADRILDEQSKMPT
jgi:negative regulator of flagellin synthesis FlgM